MAEFAGHVTVVYAIGALPWLRDPPAGTPAKSCAWLPNALNRHGSMLSTTANPTFGLRFDDDAPHRRPIGSF
jgi:hypothetical protein